MFTYAEVETILASLHRADAATQKGALRGRLKHFKKLGIPLGINPGKGARIAYTIDTIWEWSFCLSLSQAGLDPTVIATILKYNWTALILPEFKSCDAGTVDGTSFFYLEPWLMTRSWGGYKDALFEGVGDIGIATRAELNAMLDASSLDGSPLLLIDLKRLVHSINVAASYINRK